MGQVAFWPKCVTPLSPAKLSLVFVGKSYTEPGMHLL